MYKIIKNNIKQYEPLGITKLFSHTTGLDFNKPLSKFKI